MSTDFPSAARHYCIAKKHSKGTSDEYKATVRKWISWGQDVQLEQLSRSTIRDFLDWVYEHAIELLAVDPTSFSWSLAQLASCRRGAAFCTMI
ncbi:site-specific integrase [Stieleria neptunia]|uniref:site-specific integrase n=1 Tax=Stieleria neptunia TaxID=2527979 RepID=UPI0011A1BC99